MVWRKGAGMKRARKSTGKRLRFEIFKRDGFKCLYCGASPVQKVLRVDHVVPVVDGGETKADNLVTACFDCNAGKAGVSLQALAVPVSIATEADKERASQILEWLALQREIDAAKAEVSMAFAGAWQDRVGQLSQEMFERIPKLLSEWTNEALTDAIAIVARKHGTVGQPYDYGSALIQQKYFYGILRRWRGRGQS